MSKSMAQLGVGAVAAIVLLRLAVGWHFYTEGVKKFEPGFTSAGLLSSAVGPLEGVYQSFVPSPGDYETNLATPRAWGSITDEQAEENAAWRSEHREAVKASQKAKEIPLAGFAPYSAYSDWANAIGKAWEAKRDKALKLVADDKKQAVEDAYRKRLQQLADYLDSESEAIEEFRHELWRLERMQQKPGADSVGFETESIGFREERIADKRAETGRTARKWKAAVWTLQSEYVDDLAALADDRPAARRAVKTRSHLDWIDPTVTFVVTGIGVCMLLGLCTRLAGVAGAGFLLSVMATQPPWVPGANTEFLGYQLAEVGAMLTLAAIGAGRWFGLDSLLRRVCPSFCCGPRG